MSNSNELERLSPNVVLRPVYQQSVLPGVAYVGGGSEIAYWMEIKQVFSAFEIPFPVLVRRDSATWINPHISRLMDALSLSNVDTFKTLQQVQDDYLAAQDDSDWTLSGLGPLSDQYFLSLRNEVSRKDPGLEKMVKGFEVQHQHFVQKTGIQNKENHKDKI